MSLEQQQTIILSCRAMENLVVDFRGAFPDLRFTLLDHVFEPDGSCRGACCGMRASRLHWRRRNASFAVHWSFKATMKGDFLGMPRTGAVEELAGTTVVRVDTARGRIVETEVFRSCSTTEEQYQEEMNWDV